MDKPDGIKPDAISEVARYSTIKQFKEYLELYNLEKTITLLENNNAMHEIAYPFTPQELDYYNKKHQTSCNKHDIARIHAVKLDLFLTKVRTSKTLLFTPNKHKITPGVLAAQTGYLPVLARIMLANPIDWAIVITYLPQDYKSVLIATFLEYIRKPRPIHIVRNLQVDLSESQMTHLREWAETTSPSWPQLDREQTKYLFSCYLTTDIYRQYMENPNHPKVKDLLKTCGT